MVSALLTTFGAFAVILLLGRMKVPLAAAIVIGAAAIGLGFGLPPLDVLIAGGEGLIRPGSIGLIAVTACLLAVSGTMQAGGRMDRIVSLTRSLLRRPVVAMAALPALIGLLPMPGGALFSAPMVASVAGGEKISPAKLSAVNYWFRHVWECWWPLYPGVIVAMALTGRDVTTFVPFQFPLMLITIAAGTLILRGTHPNLHVSGPPPARGTKRKLFKATFPIWVILLVWAGVKLLLVAALGSAPTPAPGGPPLSYGEAAVSTLHSYLPIALGLVVSLIWTVRSAHLGARGVGKAFADPRVWKMAALVAGVMIFQHMLHEVEGAAGIRQELEALNVPVLAVLMILPFIAGMVTGIAVGFVSTSFPIVLELIQDVPSQSVAAYIALAYLFGHMGQMLSPLHLCHLMSNDYFKTHFAPVYRQIIPPAILTAAAALVYFFCLRSILS